MWVPKLSLVIPALSAPAISTASMQVKLRLVHLSYLGQDTHGQVGASSGADTHLALQAYT